MFNNYFNGIIWGVCRRKVGVSFDIVALGEMWELIGKSVSLDSSTIVLMT